MDVFVANEQQILVDEVRMSALAAHTLTMEEVDDAAELSVLLVTSDHIKRLNKRFAGDAHATDVLAFPMMEGDESELLVGDVVICPQIAAQHAEKIGHSLTDELDTLVVHGTLHLLGYDHQNARDKQQMDERQREVLTAFQASSV